MPFYRLTEISARPFYYLHRLIRQTSYIKIFGVIAVIKKNIINGSITDGNPTNKLKMITKYLKDAHRKSFDIGHLGGEEKFSAYKRVFKGIIQ